ncbi:MAG: hypothetical protein M3443_02700 [Actinomycetota bacterium]|nr:hypothetical protein [Actinomycetota bacterium]
MTYSAPGGPRRDIFSSPLLHPPQTSTVDEARAEAERLKARPPMTHNDPREVAPLAPLAVVEVEEASESGLSPLRRLLEHEEARAVARRADDSESADRALGAVVVDLDGLLDAVSAHLRYAGRGKSRQLVKEAVPRLVAVFSLTDLPLGEVADSLDIDRAEVDTVLAALAAHGGLSPAERHGAVAGIEKLRERLREAEITRDHAALDRLIEVIVGIDLLVAVAASVAPMAALAAGESVVNEVVKAGIIALVTVALVAPTSRDSRVVDAHDALLTELAEAGGLARKPAYHGEHAVIRIKLHLRCGAARLASIPSVWADKQRYWDLLDEVTAALDQWRPDTLDHSLHQLRALTPPPR